MRAIIAAAGTGGHINPGIAIANKIKEEEPNSEIIFIGTGKKLEQDLVNRAGFKLRAIDACGLSLNPKKLIKTLKGFGEAKKIIKEFKPDVVIGTGGYICGAVITEANKMNIPTLLHESNAFPGKAVKMLTNRTDTIMVGFDAAKDRLQGAKKIVVTGNPSKMGKLKLTNKQKDDLIKQLGLSVEKPILLVFGGSQGARAINNSIIKIVKSKANKNYQIIWAPGPIQYDIIKEELEKDGFDINNIENVKVYPYIYNMEEIMNVADLLICRSGAMTINEVALVGKPAIFIPLPGVSQNHQEYNARVLEDVGAAKIILNEELEKIDLNNKIEELIFNQELLKQMGENAKKMSNQNSLDVIYKEIKDAILLHTC